MEDYQQLNTWFWKRRPQQNPATSFRLEAKTKMWDFFHVEQKQQHRVEKRN